MTIAIKPGSTRISRLRDKLLITPSVCIERGYWMTESYKETEHEPIIVRKAKALEKILKEMTIGIEDEELIVGRATSKQRGAALLPEVQWEFYLKEMDTLSTRYWDRFEPFTEEEEAKMKEFLPWWQGKALYDKWRALIPEEALRLNHVVQSGGAYCLNNMYYGHMSVDYGRVINEGLNGIKRQVDAELGKLDLADLNALEKYHFLRALNITIEAAKNFARRYADLAKSMAERETDKQRQKELARIAATLDRVPAEPARDFYEAVQSLWFTHLVVVIESWPSGSCYGRADQYLYPFYKRDLEEGKITREEARELLAMLLLKANGLATIYPSEIVETFNTYIMMSTTVLGGITEDGKDAVNDLSYLYLDAETDVRLTMDDIVVRIHKNTPDAFVMKACEVAKKLGGKIKFLSDETTIQQLLNDGKPVEYARDYIVTGCFCPTVPARSLDIPGGMVNMPLMLELALNNGVSRLTGEQIGPQTGDPRKFKSYEEVWEAYKKQVAALVHVILLFKNADKQVYAEFAPTPFQSAVYQGCIEKGLDITNGGTAPYISHGIALSGAPNVGDSLAAMKKLVFEEKKISMDELITALDKNFEGEERILHLLESAPKFGNDDDYVDSIVNELLVHGSYEAGKTRGFAGALSTVSASSGPAAIPLGRQVGALPDSRRAGEAISEGGISPHQGRNVTGPTATMRSVAKLDHVKLTNGSVLNMKFHPDAVSDETKMKKFASLIRTYCETGGFLVQFNIIGTDTLKDAQLHPENYRDLLVRVATYSAYFVELSKEVQDNIIARTEFQEV